VDYLDKDLQLSGLLMSDGWEQKGLIAWQLRCNGCEMLDIYAEPIGRGCPTSMPVFDKRRLHRWTHLVVVYEQNTGTIRFYVDGRRMGESGLIAPGAVISIGSARIGQWDDKGRRGGNEGSRNFRGRIDELAIFGRSLTWDEIRQMFDAGKPVGDRNILTPDTERGP
jgi:hypothetical protein